MNSRAGSGTLSKAQLQEKIAALKEKKEWHEELLAQLDEEDKQISVTDPDTRRMPTAQGNQVGYNAQLAVDAKHKLIAADDVTNDVTDINQLATVALEAKANLELKQTEVVADAGYYNASEVSRCVEQNIQPFIPKADTSANTARGLYGKSRFKFDADKDVYVCPAGGELSYRFSTYELGRELRYYRAARLPAVCAQEPMHAQQSQPDDYAGGQRAFDGGNGRADETGAREVPVEEDLGRASVRDHQAVHGLHPFPAQRTGESADRMESDHAGV